MQEVVVVATTGGTTSELQTGLQTLKKCTAAIQGIAWASFRL